VRWIVRETDDDLAKRAIEGFYAAKAPAFVLAEGTRLEREQGLGAGYRGRERCTILVKFCDRENGFKPRVGLVDMAQSFDKLGAELLVCWLRFRLQLKGIEPFVMFAGGFEILDNQPGELGGQLGLSDICKLLYQKEQELRLVRELLCNLQPHGLCVVPVTLGQEVFELLMLLLCRSHL